MKKAKFPGLNSRRWIKFIDKLPAQEEGESDDSFARRRALAEAIEYVEICVLMLDRSTVQDLQQRMMTVAAKEDARRAEKDAAHGLSLEFLNGMRAMHREVVETYVVGMRGIEVGDVDLESITDPKMLALAIDTAGLLADASRIAREAQFPTPQQLEPSGSS